MMDITQRLRRWTISTDAMPASDLMDEAADEIERLRLGIATQTDHDAAPAAKACTYADRDRHDKAVTRPGEGTGDTFSPIAKREIDRPDAIATPGTPCTPGECSVQGGCALTDTEREAVEQAIDAGYGMEDAEPWALETLRELLKRLG